MCLSAGVSGEVCLIFTPAADSLRRQRLHVDGSVLWNHIGVNINETNFLKPSLNPDYIRPEARKPSKARTVARTKRPRT